VLIKLFFFPLFRYPFFFVFLLLLLLTAFTRPAPGAVAGLKHFTLAINVPCAQSDSHNENKDAGQAQVISQRQKGCQEREEAFELGPRTSSPLQSLNWISFCER